jgi:hypothetical protein
VVRVGYDVLGVTRHRWEVDAEPPVFSENREYIERHLAVLPEEA